MGQAGDLTQGCRWPITEEDSLIMTCCDTPISLTAVVKADTPERTSLTVRRKALRSLCIVSRVTRLDYNSKLLRKQNQIKINDSFCSCVLSSTSARLIPFNQLRDEGSQLKTKRGEERLFKCERFHFSMLFFRVILI